MNSMPKDAQFIADRLKLIRKMASLTQENVADLCGLTTRTIQKIESGRHIPDEQTIRSLCRGLKFEASIFDKPTPEEEIQLRREFEYAMRKITVVPTEPLRSVRDFLTHPWNRDAYRIDYSAIDSDAVLSIATGMMDFIRDVGDLWEDLDETHRMEFGEGFLDYVKQLDSHGYALYAGHHRERMKGGKGPLTFDVGDLSFQKKKAEKNETLYAIVQLDGHWEVPEEDRPTMPVEDQHAQ